MNPTHATGKTMRNTTQLRTILTASLLFAACGSDSAPFRNVDGNGTVDTGTDTGTSDTGTTDTGTGADTGTTDTGTDTRPVIPIDPTATDEVAFQAALDLYNALDYAGASNIFVSGRLSDVTTAGPDEMREAILNAVSEYLAPR